MKIAVERTPLLKSLTHMQRVVEKKNTFPILANVLLRARDGELELKATDLDIEITQKIPANIFDDGATTVPAQKLYEIVRKLADGAEIRLETDGKGSMVLTSGRSRFNIACLSTDSFPDLTSGTASSTFTVQASAFKALLDRTAFAASSEETRYYLNGIHFHILERDNAKVLRAVATDGHRMARTEIPAPAGSETMPSIIMPRKTVGELQKLLDGADLDIEIGVSDTKIRVTAGKVVLLSKLIEGTFPDYERVTPKHNDKRMEVDRAEFSTAVDRVSTIASDRGGKAIKLAATDGKLELSVTNPDHGTATEEMPVEFDTDHFEIGFNAKYLLDIVSQVKSDIVTFMFNDSGSPALISEGENGETVYVLMPMRT